MDQRFSVSLGSAQQQYHSELHTGGEVCVCVCVCVFIYYILGFLQEDGCKVIINKIINCV